MDANDRCEAARVLAHMLLMIDEATGDDLTLRYLKILIETGLPRAARPKLEALVGELFGHGLPQGFLIVDQQEVPGFGHQVTAF